MSGFLGKIEFVFDEAWSKIKEVLERSGAADEAHKALDSALNDAKEQGRQILSEAQEAAKKDASTVLQGVEQALETVDPNKPKS